MKTNLIILLASFMFIQTMSSQKNILQLGLGIGGSDGVDEQPTYDITYKRQLTKYLFGTLQYARLDGEEEGLGTRLSGFSGDKFVGPKNESENPITDLNLTSSLYLGIEVGVVRTTMSTLYLIGGVRYQMLSSTNIISSGSEEEFFDVNFYSYSQLGPEIGIGYNRRFTARYSVGGKFVIGPKTSFFAASLTGGVYF